MKPTVNINNNIFVYTLIGVMLFIAALGFTLTNFAGITSLHLSSVLIAGTLGFSSISLLAKAIKADNKHRLNDTAQV